MDYWFIKAIMDSNVVTLFSYDLNDYRIEKYNPSALLKNQYLMEGEHYEAIYDESEQIKAKFMRGVVVDEIVNGYYYDEHRARGTSLNSKIT